MRKRSWRTPAATSALVVAMVASGCASLPAGGIVQLKTLHGSDGGSAQGVQVLPVPPGPDWSAKQIVRGFLAVSASFDPSHRIAKEYLTPTYERQWKPGWAATVIGAQPAIRNQPAPRHPLPGSSQDVVINVTSPYVARMTTTALPYEAGNLVVSPERTQYQFLITNESGHNRISGINLNGRPTSPRILLMTQPDFDRDYQTRNLYFFPLGTRYFQAGASAKMLIPDPVPIPLQATGVQAVRGLVTSLFNPPPDASWLSGAATTAFPSVPRNVPVPMSVRIVGGIKAVIDLSGAAAKASPAQLRRMAAQLYATLTSSPYSASPAAQIQSVVLKVNHHVVSQPLPPPYANWIPRAGTSSDQLYFQGPAELPAPAVETVKNGKLVPVPLPGELGGAAFDEIAVSPGPAKWAVLAGCAAKRVYLLPQWQGGKVISRTLPADCTSLSWDTHGNLWLSAGKGAFVIRGAGPGGRAPVSHGGAVGTAGPVTKVCFLTCAPSGSTAPTIAKLRVAPDGVRVAMIVQSGSSSQVVLSAITSNPSYVYIGAAKPMRLGSDISDPGALAWLDSDHLLVLDHAGMVNSRIYEVPLSGGSSTQIATPRYAKWLAASWPDADHLPRVVVGITGPQSQVLSFNAGLLNRGWSQVAKGTTPALPG